MGVSNVTNRVAYAGDGSSAVFAFPYYFFVPTDINVAVYNSSAVTINTLILNTNFSISGTQNAQGLYSSGANVICNSSPGPNDKIVIWRDPPQLQTYSLIQNQEIAAAPLVQQFDYLTLLAQRIDDVLGRSLSLPDGLTPVFNTTLPSTICMGSSAYSPLIINGSSNGLTLGVVALGGSSAVSYLGTLPVANGGTGQAGALTPGGVAYGASATQMATSAAGTNGQVLLSGGTGAPSWGSVSLGSSIVGVLAVAQGGTGNGSSFIGFQSSTLVFASSAIQLASLGGAATGLPLLSQGSSAPLFTQLSLTTGVTGTLPIANGGTGQVTANAGFNALSPMTAWGDVIYSGSGVIATRLAAGTNGQFLTSGGPNANPSWTSGLTNPLTLLGDMIYAGSAAVTTRLAGNLSNSSAILVQTGAGGVSAAPVWTLYQPHKIELLTGGSSATYTVLTGARWIKVSMVGAGGGGSGGGSGSPGSGTAGATTSFGVMTATGGSAGGSGGAGGSGTNGDIISTGGPGQGTGSLASSFGGIGGTSLMGGGGIGGSNSGGGGGAGGNYGGGGGGGGGNAAVGAGIGGGGGGYAERIFAGSSLLATFTYTLSGGGAAGAAGTSGGVAGPGGPGVIKVETSFF